MLSANFVKQKAIQIGFDDCGIAHAEPMPQFFDKLSSWVENGYCAEMKFMADMMQKRSDPTLLVAGAQSVISVVVGYKPSRTMCGKHKIAQYAYGEDYHVRIKQMLYQLIAAIQQEYPNFEAKPCVDTVPISDKLWAVRAGLGWIGRNTLLITPTMGSYVNIGELVTTATLDQYDSPIENKCGACTKCVDACPNHALSVCLDARHCSSYNTIENRNELLPEDINLKGYVFGCDYCQLVCPYNQQAVFKVDISAERINELESLMDADEFTFKKMTKHSAMNRIKYYQWKRNLSFTK